MTIVDPSAVPRDAVFRLTFFDATVAESGLYQNVAYELQNMTSREVLIPRSVVRPSTPFVAGITIDEVGLDLLRTGWVGTDEDGEEAISRDPADVSGLLTNWQVSVTEDQSPFTSVTTDEYRLRYATDSLFSTSRFAGGFIDAAIPWWCENGTERTVCDLLVFDANENGAFDRDRARAEMADVAVVPNPYVAAAAWEESTQITCRGPRKIQFVNLPEQCTIWIFTVRGELVRTIRHDGVAGDGAAWWDLKTRDGQDVAYGMYLYHVEAPGVGEASGKFAVVK